MTRTSGFAAIDRIGSFANAPQDFRQARRNRRKSDNRKIPERETGSERLRRPCARRRRRKTAHVPCVRCLIAAISAAPSRSPDSSPATRKTCGLMCSIRAGTPMTKYPGAVRRRARRCSGSAMTVLPATTAMPASPARATPSTVRGPIDGKSNRWSWPGFGAFTSTPTAGRSADAAVCTQLGNARQHLVRAFRRLHRQYALAGHHHSLPDIERAARAANIRNRTQCLARSLLRQRRRDRVRLPGTRISGATSCAPSKTKSLFLEQLAHARETDDCRRHDKHAMMRRQQYQRLEIGTKLPQRRPHQRTNQHDVTATCGRVRKPRKVPQIARPEASDADSAQPLPGSAMPAKSETAQDRARASQTHPPPPEATCRRRKSARAGRPAQRLGRCSCVPVRLVALDGHRQRPLCRHG